MSSFDRGVLESVLGKVPIVETSSVAVAWTDACSADSVSLPWLLIMLPPSFVRTPCVTMGRRLDFSSDMSQKMLPLAPGQDVSGGVPGSVKPYMLCALKESKLQEVAQQVFDLPCAPPPEPRLYADDCGLHGDVGRLLAEGLRGTPDADYIMESLSTLVIVDYLRSLLSRKQQEKEDHTHHAGIRRAIATMEERLEDPLSLCDLAQEACLSVSRFIAVFKNEVGCTPHEHLRRLRVQAAMRMLRSGKDVTHTCFSAGFTSLSGFEEAFRSRTGMTPAAYRRMAAQ